MGAVLFVALVPGTLTGQPFYRSELTASLEPVLDLKGIWVDANGNRHAVPFNYSDRREIEVRRTVDLPKGKDLYLYFEGLAWTGEVYFNEVLLAITQDPFAENLLYIPNSILLERGNVIRVRLRSKGADYPLYPSHFVGIFRQAVILQVADAPQAWTPPSYIEASNRVVVVAPWSRSGEYLSDSLAVESSLYGLFAYPASDPVYFPFRPSNRSQSFLAQRGIQVARSVRPTDSIAFYNPYPVKEQPLQQNVAFWRRDDGRPDSGYGNYSTLERLRTLAVSSPNQLALLLLLLIPVMVLLLMKLATPRVYGVMFEFLTKTKIYLELIANNKFLKSQQRWLLNFLRMVLVAVLLTVLVYFWDQTGRLESLGLLTTRGPLRNILIEGSFSLYQLFLGILVLLVGLNLLKYGFLNGLGGIYRVGWLSVMLQNLDIFSSLPMILLPLLPAPFIFFVDPFTSQIILWIWYGLILVYFLRRIVLIYIGMTRLFSFSRGLKFLYICTLEILPWIILL